MSQPWTCPCRGQTCAIHLSLRPNYNALARQHEQPSLCSSPCPSSSQSLYQFSSSLGISEIWPPMPAPYCLPALLSILPVILRTCGEQPANIFQSEELFRSTLALQTLVRPAVETPTYPVGLPPSLTGKTSITTRKHPPCFDVFDLCPHSVTIDERPWNRLDEARCTARVVNHLILAPLIMGFTANETIVLASVYIMLMTVWWHISSCLHIRVHTCKY